MHWELYNIFCPLLVTKFGVSIINTSIQQGCIKLIKSESKDIYNVTKDFHFKYCIYILFYFFLLIKKNHSFHKNVCSMYIIYSLSFSPLSELLGTDFCSNTHFRMSKSLQINVSDVLIHLLIISLVHCLFNCQWRKWMRKYLQSQGRQAHFHALLY